jgi:hypothetical protein
LLNPERWGNDGNGKHKHETGGKRWGKGGEIRSFMRI